MDCVRTPIGRAHKERGVFRDVRSDDLAVAVVRALGGRRDPEERAIVDFLYEVILPSVRES